MNKKLICPIESCGASVPLPYSTRYQNLQQHFWWHHRIEVAESHRMAARLADPPKVRSTHHYRKRFIADPKQVEFLLKQLKLNFSQNEEGPGDES
jgi:hypothetical protein